MTSSRHGTITNERSLRMRSPRPVEGRASKYGYQGSSSDGRLGYQMEDLGLGPNPNSNPNPITLTLTLTLAR